ncbi:MAG: alpha/beta fold hydrolase [Pikeienuella sp.]
MHIHDFTCDLTLHHGGILHGARLRYAVMGKLNEAADNLVVFPTSYAGTHENVQWLIGADKALDPAKYCIVIPNQLGNGESLSPSDGAGPGFPRISHADNIEIQRQMLASAFSGADIALAIGWSMGAQQACRWAVEAPAHVKRLMMICGTARTRPHNRVFLESLLATLRVDPRYQTDEPPEAGLKAFGRIYAGWAHSQMWLREQKHQLLGFDTLEDWVAGFWEARFGARDANNLTSMALTWIDHDVADGGDLAAALGRITADTIVMPSATDLYFTPADCLADAELIPHAEFREIPTDWGHMAGSGQSPDDTAFINSAVAELLAR